MDEKLIREINKAHISYRDKIQKLCDSNNIDWQISQSIGNRFLMAGNGCFQHHVGYLVTQLHYLIEILEQHYQDYDTEEEKRVIAHCAESISKLLTYQCDRTTH